MFDPKQAGRLLRQDWASPIDLARELYDLFTGSEKKTIRGPLEIKVPDGQTGLKLIRSKPESTSASGSRPAPPKVRLNATQIPQTKRPDLQVTDIGEPYKPGEPAQPFSSRPPDSPSSRSSSVDSSQIRRPSTTETPRSSKSPIPTHPGSYGPQVQIGPGPNGPRRQPDTPTQLAKFAKPYQAPLFEVADEVRFSGINPVQFDRPPWIYNPSTDQYEPYRFDGSLTRIPLDVDDGADTWFGQVLSGGAGLTPSNYGTTNTGTNTGIVSLGSYYLCNLLADPNPETQPDFPGVKVNVYNIDSLDTIPQGTLIYPVVQDSDGNFWGKAEVWF